MKNLIKFILTILIFTPILINCENKLPEVDEMGELNTNVAYIEDFKSSPQKRFTVSDEGGKVEFNPRIANLVNSSVKFNIEVDESILESYNKENKTNFKVLPKSLYNLSYKDEEGKEINDKKLTVTLNPKEIGKTIAVKVGSLLDKEGNNLLSYYENFAIPVRLKNTEGGARDQATGTTGILFIDRKFTTPVMKLKGSIGLIYKENTMPQAPGKVYEGDIKYPEWTVQYSIRLNGVTSNVGLLYPNLRTDRNSPLYMTLYSGSLTLFAGNGKEWFNQPKFKEFIFKKDTWYHLAVSYKEENGKPYLSMYLNGELAYKGLWPRKVDEWPILFLGNSGFNGYVRELRFWSRALTQGEINSTLWFADPKSEGLEVYMPFSKDKKTIIKGKEEDWIDISTGTVDFETKFTFPAED